MEYIYDVDDGGSHAFRTAPNKRIDPATDELGTLAPSGHNAKGSGDTYAYGINDSGQVVGTSDIGINAPFGGTFHAFRTAPNGAINPATDDLEHLGERIALLRQLITMARWWALPTYPETLSTE